MSYLVLARKYRPRTFDEVVGQPAVAKTLKNALRMDRIAHAYLFSGPRGVGKTSLARILARSLCCEKGPTIEPCGTCPRCISILKGSDLDVVEIDAASNRGIDDIRELRERARVAPMLGRHKLYIIDEAHQLTNEAFNALLKILEEPPGHVLFVLATTEPERIPETIRSRCQWFEFRRVADAEIIGRLKVICVAEGIEVEDAALAAIAHGAKGGMRDSQSLLDQVITHGGGKVTLADALAVLGALSTDTVSELLRAIFAGDAAAVAREIDRLDAEGIAAENVLDAVLGAMGERTRVAATAVAGSPEAGQLDRLLSVSNLLLAGRRRVRDHDEPRLALELLLLRLARLGDALPIRDALEVLRSGAVAAAGQSAPPVHSASSTQAPAAARKAPPPHRGLDAGSAFDRIVREVEATHAPIGAWLRGFKPRALDGDVLEIAPQGARNTMYSLADARVRKAIEDAAMKTCGRPIAVQIAEDGSATLDGASDPRMVERAIEMFEGRRVE